MAAVAMHTIASAAVSQCTARSAGLNRRSSGAVRTGSAGGGIVAPIRASDPRVDVVAELFPVARLNAVGEFDAREPLGALVPVHGCDVHTDRTAVVVAD